MPNPYGVPEITVRELAVKLNTDNQFSVLDIREESELLKARLNHEKVIALSLSELAQGGSKLLPASLQDPEKEIAVLCHHGVRSAQVTLWMRHHGWKKVFSVAGGIEAYANEVEPDIGRY